VTSAMLSLLPRAKSGPRKRRRRTPWCCPEVMLHSCYLHGGRGWGRYVNIMCSWCFFSDSMNERRKLGIRVWSDGVVIDWGTILDIGRCFRVISLIFCFMNWKRVLGNVVGHSKFMFIVCGQHGKWTWTIWDSLFLEMLLCWCAWFEREIYCIQSLLNFFSDEFSLEIPSGRSMSLVRNTIPKLMPSIRRGSRRQRTKMVLQFPQ
jgi:hypothetical protein